MLRGMAANAGRQGMGGSNPAAKGGMTAADMAKRRASAHGGAGSPSLPGVLKAKKLKVSMKSRSGDWGASPTPEEEDAKGGKRKDRLGLRGLVDSLKFRTIIVVIITASTIATAVDGPFMKA